MAVVFNDLFLSVYRYLGFSLLFAIVVMIAWPAIEERGIKVVLIELIIKFKTDRYYLYRFIFFTYLFMVLSRTLICRNIWQCPWENIIGEWGLYTSEDEFNLGGLENLFLFVPLTIFGLLSNFHILAGLRGKQLLKFAFKWSFLFTFFIECCQLFLRLGTFQLSDIAQNTAGGVIGWGIYWGVEKIQKRRKSHNENN